MSHTEKLQNLHIFIFLNLLLMKNILIVGVCGQVHLTLSTHLPVPTLRKH